MNLPEISKTNMDQIIGANIRKYRKRQGMTIEQLADLVGISSSYMGLIERGKRGIGKENLVKVAAIFHKSLDELIGLEVGLTENPEQRQNMLVQQINEICSVLEKDALLSVLSYAKNMNLSIPAGEKENDTLRAKMEKTIEELDLSTRAYNCLRRDWIWTVSDLTQKTEKQLLKINNFGMACLNQVKAELSSLGLSLKKDKPKRNKQANM